LRQKCNFCKHMRNKNKCEHREHLLLKATPPGLNKISPEILLTKSLILKNIASEMQFL
jgi:hypothetical protein